MVEQQLPKLNTRVRFPSPAPSIQNFYYLSIASAVLGWRGPEMSGDDIRPRSMVSCPTTGAFPMMPLLTMVLRPECGSTICTS